MYRENPGGAKVSCTCNMKGCRTCLSDTRYSRPVPDALDIDELMGIIEQNSFYTNCREKDEVVKVDDVRLAIVEYLGRQQEEQG
jgi:hypothetical protein